MTTDKFVAYTDILIDGRRDTIARELMPEILSADEIKDMQRAFAKEKKMKDLPSKSQILQSYFSAVKE